jgi:hypothetical protein
MAIKALTGLNLERVESRDLARLGCLWRSDR